MMNVRISLVLALALLIFGILPSPTLADDTETPHYPSLFTPGAFLDTVLMGVHWTENEQFAKAESLFTVMSAQYPRSPIGPLFMAAAIHGEMLDQESPARAVEFHRWLDETINEAELWRTSHPGNGEPEFILGAALGYDAVYESHWGGWFAALKRGLSAKNHFKHALELDTTLTDAYLGLGTYNYWKSVKTDFINWLPIVPDDRQKGLNQLRRVIEHGTISRNAARASLCYALMNEGDYLTAIAHADTLATHLPNAKSPLWILAEANMALYRWNDAAEYYDDVESRIKDDGPGNYFNLIESAANRARALYEAGRYREALAECHAGLSYPAPNDIRKRHDRTLEQLRDLQHTVKDLTHPGN
ncbi:MAG: hypothetical protein GF341_00045 [candidate division Zixibacteria bacterium]|nr:hypothetical protein [candidate division Zixibacteria bacterium]